MGNLTEHFDLEEFNCKDGTPVPTEWIPRVKELCQNLEVLREYLGGNPVSIVSGYRTLSYNKKCGGALKSQHMEARASDIRVSGYTPEQVATAIKKLISLGKMKQGGVGLYGTFTHYDTRGTAARWSGTGAKDDN
jgi:uncharacterized protein YcbK (DUF882 family)